jgi:hypothetical protein
MGKKGLRKPKKEPILPKEDLILEPFEGSEPGERPLVVERATHRHVWELLPDPLDRPSQVEFCLICHERRQVGKPESRVFIPQPGNRRTGY